MLPIVGFVLIWLGYGVGYYGFNRITGGNDRFRSLFWPGDYTPTPRDGQSASGPTPKAAPAPAAATTQAAGGQAPTVGGSSFGGASGAIHP